MFQPPLNWISAKEENISQNHRRLRPIDAIFHNLRYSSLVNECIGDFAKIEERPKRIR
jgi:hypothetical protein